MVEQTLCKRKVGGSIPSIGSMKCCLFCSKELKRSDRKYCNNLCQWHYQYVKFIESWKQESNKQTAQTKNISKFIKRYLIQMHGEKCSRCNWQEKHPITLRVPLEVDHIDGDATNNIEANLQLLCPNCHALTANYRNLNFGKGRIWRRKLKD